MADASSSSSVLGPLEEDNQSAVPTVTSRKWPLSNYIPPNYSKAPHERLQRRADCFEENIVYIGSQGFSRKSITISAGQIVTFKWMVNESEGYNVVQVIQDGEELYRVVGGIYSGAPTKQGHFEHQFNLKGEYKFSSDNEDLLEIPPFVVTVRPRREIHATLIEEGFQPTIVHAEVGDTVKWSWNHLKDPVRVYEATFCREHNRFYSSTDKNDWQSVANNFGKFIKKCQSPGLYYVVSKGSSQQYLCVLCIHSTSREHRVKVLDREFDPTVLVVDQGDRVWWSWDKGRKEVTHPICQIEPPTRTAPFGDWYVPMKNGFCWPRKTRSGFFSHVFDKPGKYFYVECNHEDHFDNLGVIMVLPKQAEYKIRINKGTVEPEILSILSGSRVWWEWNPHEYSQPIQMILTDICSSSNSVDTSLKCPDVKYCHSISSDEMKTRHHVGRDCIEFNLPGVYEFLLGSGKSNSTIVAKPKYKTHHIRLCRETFEPASIHIHVGDSIHWEWKEVRHFHKQRLTIVSHNIVQITSDGYPMPDGFSSGPLMQPPSFFVHTFPNKGVFYFTSEGLKGKLGIILVTDSTNIHTLNVEQHEVLSGSMNPLVSVGDTLVWNFSELQHSDFIEVKDLSDIRQRIAQCVSITPRHSIVKKFNISGLFHYTSPSFLPSMRDSEAAMPGLTNVAVHTCSDFVTVQLQSDRCFPSQVVIHVHQTVCWIWEESWKHPLCIDQMEEGESVNLISLPQSRCKSFYTFDKVGMYRLSSHTIKCMILVLSNPTVSSPPVFIHDSVDGEVPTGFTVQMKSQDPHVQIYYTLDGTPPELHSHSISLYDSGKGISLLNEGITLIRAVSQSRHCMLSEAVVSRAFYVKGDPLSNEDTTNSRLVVGDCTPTNEEWQWFNSHLTIEMHIEAAGCLRIDCNVSEAAKNLIKSCQFSVNGHVRLCATDEFPSSVLMKGFIAYKDYSISMQLLAKHDHLSPLNSNIIQVRFPGFAWPVEPCAKKRTYNHDLGDSTSLDDSENEEDDMSRQIPKFIFENLCDGPLMSICVSSTEDMRPFIVWPVMDCDIPSRPSESKFGMPMHWTASEIEEYYIYVNGSQLCGPLIQQNNASFMSFQLADLHVNQRYEVWISAIVADSRYECFSNKLVFQLPLRCESNMLDTQYSNVPVEYLFVEFTDRNLMRDSSCPPDDNAGNERLVDMQSDVAQELVMKIADDIHVFEASNSVERKSTVLIQPECDLDHSDEDTVEKDNSDGEESVELSSVQRKPIDSEDEHDQCTSLDMQVKDKRTEKQRITVKWQIVNQEYCVQHGEQRFRIICLGDISQTSIVANDSRVTNLMENPDNSCEGIYRSEWAVSNLDKVKLSGFLPTQSYEIFVEAILTIKTNKISSTHLPEIVIESNHVHLGSESHVINPSFTLNVHYVGIEMVHLWWDLSQMDISMEKWLNRSKVDLIVNEIDREVTVSDDDCSVTVENLPPGETSDIVIRIYFKDAAQLVSFPLYVDCPNIPSVPELQEEDSYLLTAVPIGWKIPWNSTISYFRLYKDGNLLINLPAVESQERYEYIIKPWPPGVTHEIAIETVAGPTRDAQPTKIMCKAVSRRSVPLVITLEHKITIPPLQVINMTIDTVLLGWDAIEYDDSKYVVKSLQIVKGDDSCDQTLNQEERTFLLKEVTLGEKIHLRLMAWITTKSEDRSKSSSLLLKENDEIEEDDWISVSSTELIVSMDHIVQSPQNIVVEKFVGNGFRLTWQCEPTSSYFIPAEEFHVSWWKRDQSNSPSRLVTTNCEAVVKGLEPKTEYFFTIESHKTAENGTCFKSNAISEVGNVMTGRLPLSGRNARIIFITRNDALIQWESTSSIDCNVTATVIIVRPLGRPVMSSEIRYISLDIDHCQCHITGLIQHTLYEFCIVTCTREYFTTLPVDHEMSIRQVLDPQPPVFYEELPGDRRWIPNCSLRECTESLEVPIQLKTIDLKANSVKVYWYSANTFSPSEIVKQSIYWWIDINLHKNVPINEENQEMKFDDKSFSSIEMAPGQTEVILEHLQPSTNYTAVLQMLVKKSKTQENQGGQVRASKETMICSEKISFSTSSTNHPPCLHVIEVTPHSVTVSWDPPQLYKLLPGNSDQEVTVHQFEHQYLHGYHLIVDGNVVARFPPDSERKYELSDLEPGSNHNIELMAFVSSKRKLQKKRSKSASSDSESSIVYLNDLSMLCDYMASPPVQIILPDPSLRQSVLSASISIDEDQDLGTMCKVNWTTSTETNINEKQTSRVPILLETEVEGKLERRLVPYTPSIESDNQTAIIPVEYPGNAYVIYLLLDVSQAQVNVCQGKEPLKEFLRLSFRSSGPLEAPFLQLSEMNSKEIFVAWTSPQCFAGITIQGYQLYVNNRPVGETLPPTTHQAILSSCLNRQYNIQVVALTSHKLYPRSSSSNIVTVNTSSESVLERPLVTKEGLDLEETSVLPLYVVSRSDEDILLDWSGYNETRHINKHSSISHQPNHYKIIWRSIKTPIYSHVIDDLSLKRYKMACSPGITYVIRVSVMSLNGSTILQSKSLLIQSSAPLDYPIFTLHSSSPSHVSVQWLTPFSHGDALLAGYEIFVNGNLQQTLKPTENIFTLTDGQCCQEYVFQIKAVSTDCKYNSCLSQPLITTWPGCLPSNLFLKRVDPHPLGKVCFSWTIQMSVGDVEVEHFYIIATDFENDSVVQQYGPFHHSSREATVDVTRNIPLDYQLALKLKNSEKLVYSQKACRLDLQTCPSPPVISVNLKNEKRRREMELHLCDVVNDVEELCRESTAAEEGITSSYKIIRCRDTSSTNQFNTDNSVKPFVESVKKRLENTQHKLKDLLELYESETGEIHASLTWEYSNHDDNLSSETGESPKMVLMGFRIYLNDYAFGEDVPFYCRQIELKLPVDMETTQSYRVSMATLAYVVRGDHTETVCGPAAEEVIISCGQFQPFLFTTLFHGQSDQETKVNQQRYLSQIDMEKETFQEIRIRSVGTYTEQMQLPPKNCQVYDVLSSRPTSWLKEKPLEFFCLWTLNCLASLRYMEYFRKLADMYPKSGDISFTAMAYESHFNGEHLRRMNELAMNHNWYDNISLLYSLGNENSSLKKECSNEEIFHQLRVPYTPYFLIIKEGKKICFAGRYCCSSEDDFVDYYSALLSGMNSNESEFSASSTYSALNHESNTTESHWDNTNSWTPHFHDVDRPKQSASISHCLTSSSPSVSHVPEGNVRKKEDNKDPRLLKQRQRQAPLKVKGTKGRVHSLLGTK